MVHGKLESPNQAEAMLDHENHKLVRVLEAEVVASQPVSCFGIEFRCATWTILAQPALVGSRIL